jgi:hypothetical protein
LNIEREGRDVAALLLVAIIGFSAVSYYFGTVSAFNSSQAQIYGLTVQNAAFQARLAPNGSCSGAGCNAYQAETGEFSQVYYAAPSSFARLFVNQTFLNAQAAKGDAWTPDCLSWCFNGIHYFNDPTYIIPNLARDFQTCKLFGSDKTDTCTKAIMGADNATWIYLSTSNTAPAAADTWSSGPCSSGNVYTSSMSGQGLGTVTAGSTGTTQTDSVAVTISFSGTTSAIYTACLLTESTAGSHVVVYGEGQIGPFTFNSGDSLTETFQDSLT